MRKCIKFSLYHAIPGGDSDGKEYTCNAGFDPWVGKTCWRRAWQPTPLFSPGKSHGQKSLEGCGPLGCKESGMTVAIEHEHTIIYDNTP